MLGICWNQFADVLKYEAKLNFSPKKRGIHESDNLKEDDIPSQLPVILTKRIILSKVNSIYDPIGLISPFPVQAKMLLNNLWKRNLQWDEEINEHDRGCAASFFVDVFDIEKISFQRCYKPGGAVGNPMLITFSDASSDAFGACAYFWWKIEGGSYSSFLIASKNRVAPMKVMSIVRLELCGAVLAKHLALFIENESRFIIEKKYFFCRFSGIERYDK